MQLPSHENPSRDRPDGLAPPGGLAVRLVAGDETVLSEILSAYGPAVLGALRSRFKAVASDEDMDEAIATALFNCWAHRSTFEPHRELGIWLYVLARNALVSNLRKQSSRPLPLPPSHPAARNSNATQSTASKSTAVDPESLHNAINRLPWKFRVVVEEYLRTNGQASYIPAAARRLHISHAYVRVLQHRALVKLRKLLNVPGDTPLLAERHQ